MALITQIEPKHAQMKISRVRVDIPTIWVVFGIKFNQHYQGRDMKVVKKPYQYAQDPYLVINSFSGMNIIFANVVLTRGGGDMEIAK